MMTSKAKVRDEMAQQNRVKWHPEVNAYVLDNQDVLLHSASRQLLLSSVQFPFFAQIDGVKTTEQILQATNAQHQPAATLFYYQINQLCEAKWLICVEQLQPYLRPLFDDVNSDRAIATIRLTENGQMMNLSALAETAMSGIKLMLLSAIKTFTTSLTMEKTFSFIVVDDFLDPRIASLTFDSHFMVVKISGDKVWLSPLFSKDEMVFFVRLQRQILDNQPIRKSLMAQWPKRTHSFAFAADQTFSDNQRRDICNLIQVQTQACEQPMLVVYDKSSKQVEQHPINLRLNINSDFAQQITAPIQLQPCISHFNQDGGSRSVTAQATVQRLMPLVSPITGIINHLQEYTASNNKPVKIYRSGFFKSPEKLDNQAFEQNDFVQTCLGKGVSPEQSKASALSEAIERYCALYQADVPRIKSTQSALERAGQRSVNFQELTPYSTLQYQCFNDKTHPDSILKQAVQSYNDNEIHWLPSWSLTREEQVYVPLSQCFTNLPLDDTQFGRWHSNGCAAGNTLEEAILQALFELIERDATAIWWYNRVTRPAFDLSRLDQDNLAKLTATLTGADKSNPGNAQDYDFWVLDLTNDLGIPVMAGIGKDKNTAGWIMGFGCHLIPEMAAQRALTELCQLIPIRDQNAAPFDFDAIVEADYLYANKDAKAEIPKLSTSNEIKQDILAIVAHLAHFELETLVLDYSRAHIPLSTAKVFVPGLCHIWPQLANERLYNVPPSQGWLKQPNSEMTINPQSLYV
ncbi:MAG: YcaO-like family protein [Algicola sp.]|nr:YcaO-like family protein [Algicola sp.]